MARDDRKINRAVLRSTVERINAGTNELQAVVTVYKPGMEDELAAVLTPDEGARLLILGVIEGDWKFTGGKAVDAKADVKTDKK